LRHYCGLGQDSHRFLADGSKKICILGGVPFKDVPGLDADSDGDVIFHSICNAITSMTHIPILGGIAGELCHKEKITDSRIYVEHALKTLGSITIHHVALALEGNRPRIQAHIDQIRKNVAFVLRLQIDQVGLTITSGNGLTKFSQGEGIQCLCMISAS
jgi:2-C-methyl-D-erythritol 2,4-cyclodiphosphate synthase